LEERCHDGKLPGQCAFGLAQLSHILCSSTIASVDRRIQIATTGKQPMRLSALMLAAVFCFTATLVQAAGVRFFDVPADTAGPSLSGVVWYPCAAPQQETKIDGGVIGFGGSDLGFLVGAKDCAIVGGKLPLIVVSHGRTGWFGGHKHTAAALADAGFVVAAINHPGDTASDQSRVDELSVLTERPTDIKRLVDFMLEAWPDAPKIDRERVGFFGFSMGGYTGLVVIGGSPALHNGVAGCEESGLRACEQLRNNETPGAPTHDPRIKAAVIVDPGPGFVFPADNLKAVTVPMQLWSSDPKLGKSHFAGCCAPGIRNRLPSEPDYRVAPNAIHFSFLAPCTPEETQKFPRICDDAPGFDRVAFHKEFHVSVLAFFQKHLGSEKL
jgi:predicted dienelactone hydrolase